MRRREPDPLEGRRRVERAQQVGELWPVLPGAEVAAVRIHVLSEQRDSRTPSARLSTSRTRCRPFGG